MNLSISTVLILIFLLCGSCGYRTSPQPIERPNSLSNVELRQRGKQLRLSWEFVIPESDASAPQAQFIIEEYILPNGCSNCAPKLVQTFSRLFPSEQLLVEGNRVYTFLPEILDDHLHLYQVRHQTLEGKQLGESKLLQKRSLIGIPIPQNIEWKWVTQEIQQWVSPLSFPIQIKKEYEYLLFQWKPEIQAIRISAFSSNSSLEEPIFYGLNLYRAFESPNQELQWSQVPLNTRPISDSFYIDQIDPFLAETGGKVPIPRHQLYLDPNWLIPQRWKYQLRFVDANGNEGLPSAIIAVPRLLKK